MEARLADDHRVLRLALHVGQRRNGHVAVLAVICDVRHAVFFGVHRQIRAAGDGANALAKGSVGIDGGGDIGYIGGAFRQRRRRQ